MVTCLAEAQRAKAGSVPRALIVQRKRRRRSIRVHACPLHCRNIPALRPPDPEFQQHYRPRQKRHGTAIQSG